MRHRSTMVTTLLSHILPPDEILLVGRRMRSAFASVGIFLTYPTGGGFSEYSAALHGSHLGRWNI